MVGHNLGEYTALQAAGVLSEHDAIYLAGKLAKRLQNYGRPGTHAMLAVKAPLDEVEGILSSAGQSTITANSSINLMQSSTARKT
jgi:acyl transferase domain-containing protein